MNWIVRGEVLEARTREGLPDLLVEVFDQDKSLQERLGSAVTDENGSFSVEFTEGDFQATGESDARELKPDLFCRVRTAEGEQLAQTPVRSDAGHNEAFIILVERRKEDTREKLKAALQLPVTILLGEQDNDPEHPNLRRTPEAVSQGEYRLARGHTFFDAARDYSEQLDVPFNWQLVTVPDADHDNSLMAPAAIPYLLND